MKKLMTALFALAVFCSLSAQGQYEQKEYVGEQGTLLYNELCPVTKAKSYPVVLFLHGAGERGDDNQKQLVHGSRMFQNPVNREKYPCYVIIPQCPEKETWAYDVSPRWSTGPDSLPVDFPESKNIKLLYGLVQKFLAEHPDANPSKVYVMGLSMGGIGTYEMCIRHPEMIAAAVPICGCVNPKRLSAAKSVKFSIYHGDTDPTVPVAGSREAYKALKAAGAKVRYKEFVGCEHNSWNPAFNESDFMSWLFKQKK